MTLDSSREAMEKIMQRTHMSAQHRAGGPGEDLSDPRISGPRAELCGHRES